MRKLPGLVGTALFALAVTVCGGDESADRAAAAAATERASGDDPASSTSSQEGTLTLDGESWSFRVTNCSRSSENAGRSVFHLRGEGEGEVEVVASREAGLRPGGPAGAEGDTGYAETIELRVGEVWDAEVHWTAMSLPSERSFLEIDGKHVSATTTFTDEVRRTEGGRPRTAEGTFDATCP